MEVLDNVSTEVEGALVDIGQRLPKRRRQKRCLEPEEGMTLSLLYCERGLFVLGSSDGMRKQRMKQRLFAWAPSAGVRFVIATSTGGFVYCLWRFLMLWSRRCDMQSCPSLRLSFTVQLPW